MVGDLRVTERGYHLGDEEKEVIKGQKSLI